MVTPQFTITSETVSQLERRKAELQEEMTRLHAEYSLVSRQLEAIPLFLGVANGHPKEPPAPPPQPAPEPISEPTAAASPEPADGSAPPSLPMAVKATLQKHGRMTAGEIRDAVLREGIPRERLGATFSYLYTVLGRLAQRGQIQKIRSKYQLAPGVTIHLKPEETDLSKF